MSTSNSGSAEARLAEEVARATVGPIFSPQAIRVTLWIALVVGLGGLVTLPFASELSVANRSALATGMGVLVASIPLLFHVARRNPNLAITVIVVEGLAACLAALFIAPGSAISVTPALLIACLLLTALHEFRMGLLAATGTTVTLITAWMFMDLQYDWFGITVFAVVLFGAVALIAFLSQYRRRLAADLARINNVVRTGSVAHDDTQGSLVAITQAIAENMSVASCTLALVEQHHLVQRAPLSDSPVIVAVLPETPDEVRVEPEHPAVLALMQQRVLVASDPDLPAPHTAQVIYVPIANGSERLGVLTLTGHPNARISDADLRVLQVYAQELGLIIMRSRMLEHAQLTAQKLTAADALKTEFLAMVSHELKTPVTAIKGFVDTILLHGDRIDTAKRNQLLERASANTNQLTRLIGQLLDFARVDADEVALRPLVCDLNDLSQRVVDNLTSILSKHQITINVDPMIRVYTDPDAYTHILTNLLTNAAKFSPTGSTITVHAATTATEGHLCVTDTGIGIAPEELDLVFERFFQSQRNGTSRKGTGIGLAIARRFVEHQGGRIWVTSTLGAGTTFTFTMPLAPKPSRLTLAPADPPPSAPTEPAANVRGQLLSDATPTGRRRGAEPPAHA
ncbi:MAG: sensor histidine kinase [Acidimicrobiia bacterium]